MKNLFSLILVLFCGYYSVAQTENIPEMKTQKGFIKIDFLSIEMPKTSTINEPNMGFSGIHYNLFLNLYLVSQTFCGINLLYKY